MINANHIPKHWQIRPLSNCGICVTGTTPPKNDPNNYGADIPFVKPPQLFDGLINDAPEKLSTKGSKLARILPVGSVLVTCIGNLGRTAFNQTPVAFNQQINAVIPSKEINGRFLFYQAQSLVFRNQLEDLSAATTVAIVNKGKFETIKIVVPPINEQLEIVSKIEELLSDLENGKQQLLTAQQQLKIYRQSLLHSAFQGKLTEQWRQQNTNNVGILGSNPSGIISTQQVTSSNPIGITTNKKGSLVRIQSLHSSIPAPGTLPMVAETKATYKKKKAVRTGLEPVTPAGTSQLPVGLEPTSTKTTESVEIEPTIPKNMAEKEGFETSEPLPLGWALVNLGNITEIKRGKSKHRPRNEPGLFNGKYPFIQTGEIRNANGGTIHQFSQTYNEVGLAQSKLWPKGTLCITIAANIGETAFLGIDACFPDSIVGILSNEDFIIPKFTNYFLLSFKSQLQKLAPATAQKNINVELLEKILLPLPSIAEQKIIIDELESKLTLCDKIEETITQSFCLL